MTGCCAIEDRLACGLHGMDGPSVLMELQFAAVVDRGCDSAGVIAHTPAGIAATDHYRFIGCYATPSILLIHCYEARTGMQIELFRGGAASSE